MRYGFISQSLRFAIESERAVVGKSAEQWNETSFLTGQQQFGVVFPDPKKRIEINENLFLPSLLMTVA
jgi:hypothetical protein